MEKELKKLNIIYDAVTICLTVVMLAGVRFLFS